MRYKTDRYGIDDLTTPVIVCNNDGIVIYKNEIAVRMIRLPKRNTDMKTHLDSAGRTEFSQIQSLSRPCVITVYTGDRNAKAFVFPYVWNNEKASMWIFAGFMQVNPSSFLFSAVEKELTKLGPDICSIIDTIAEKGTTIPTRSVDALNRRIMQRSEHLTQILLEAKSDKLNWSVNESISILRDQISSIFEEFNYKISYTEDIFPDHKRKYLNFRDFLIFYTHAFTFCCELCRGRRIKLFVRSSDTSEDMLNFHLIFSMEFPPEYVQTSSDLMELISFFPEHRIDIFIFSKLVECSGYTTHYSISDKHRDNIEFFFSIPLTSKRILSSVRNLDRETRLLQSDCNRLLEILLDYTNFTPESVLRTHSDT